MNTLTHKSSLRRAVIGTLVPFISANIISLDSNLEVYAADEKTKEASDINQKQVVITINSGETQNLTSSAITVGGINYNLGNIVTPGGIDAILNDKTVSRSAIEINYIKSVKEQIIISDKLVTEAELTKFPTIIYFARYEVNKLPESDLKNSYILRLNKLDLDKDVIQAKATFAVIVAEQSKNQTDLDIAKLLVNKMDYSKTKSSLLTRLTKVQTIINQNKKSNSRRSNGGSSPAPVQPSEPERTQDGGSDHNNQSDVNNSGIDNDFPSEGYIYNNEKNIYFGYCEPDYQKVLKK